MHKTNMDAHMKIENRSIVYTAPAATAAVVNTISHQQHRSSNSNNASETKKLIITTLPSVI